MPIGPKGHGSKRLRRLPKSAATIERPAQNGKATKMSTDKKVSIIAAIVSILGAVVAVTLVYSDLNDHVKQLDAQIKELKKPTPLDQACANLIDQTTAAIRGQATIAIRQFQDAMVAAGCKQR